MNSPIHFYLTFNPHLNRYMDSSYTQGHEFFEFLKSKIENNPNGYAYWGKMIGEDRKKEANINQMNEVIVKNSELGCSTHLYITDFHNVWVGKVDQVFEHVNDYTNTLEFYKGKKVEVWFKITDFTLLEHNSERTAKKLSSLYIDNSYSDLQINGLSPFTTKISYPAFIQDSKEEHYFDELTTDQTHLILTENPAISDNSIDRVTHSIQSLLFPEEVYGELPYSARTLIETTEMNMLEKRTHDFGKNTSSYVKTVDIVLNDLVVHYIKRQGFGNSFFVRETAGQATIEYYNSGELKTLDQYQKLFPASTLISFLEEGKDKKDHFAFSRLFGLKTQFINYVCSTFAEKIESLKFKNIRSGETTDIDGAREVRKEVLGIGCTGLIHELYQSHGMKPLKANAGKVAPVEYESTKAVGENIVDFQKVKAS